MNRAPQPHLEFETIARPDYLGLTEFRGRIEEILTGQTLDTSHFQPVLNAHDATKLVGFPVGALQTVINLPYSRTWFDLDRLTEISKLFKGAQPQHVPTNTEYAKFLAKDDALIEARKMATQVYCFRASHPGARQFQDSAQFYIMGYSQIEQIRDRALMGDSSIPMANNGIIGLREGDSLPIGRHEWLPNLGLDTSLVRQDDYLRDMYGAVSGYEADVWVRHGRFIVGRNPQSHNHNNGLLSVNVGQPIHRGSQN